MKLLHLDSSILGAHSASRSLTADIVAREKQLHPGIEVIYRDLTVEGATHLSSAHLAAWQGAVVEDEHLTVDLTKGGAFIQELFDADVVVIGAPMYNFAIPTQLKAWIDRVVVAGKTFRYGAAGAEGLLSPKKKVFIASSRGNVYAPGSPAAPLEHQETYLLGVLSFIGLTDVTVVRAEGLAFGPEAREASLAKARASIAALPA